MWEHDRYAMTTLAAVPSFRIAWQYVRLFHSGDFRAFFDGLLREAAPIALSADASANSRSSNLRVQPRDSSATLAAVYNTFNTLQHLISRPTLASFDSVRSELGRQRLPPHDRGAHPALSRTARINLTLPADFNMTLIEQDLPQLQRCILWSAGSA